MSVPIIEAGRREARKIMTQSVLIGVLVASVILYLFSPTRPRR